MAHFAKLDTNNIVTAVTVVNNETAPDEETGVAFLVNLLGGTWKQTSYNTIGGVHYAPNSRVADNGVALRKNYAGIGYTYDSVRDAFIAPKPFDSWSLNESTCLWEPPVPFPGGGSSYEWNEDAQSWDLLE